MGKAEFAAMQENMPTDFLAAFRFSVKIDDSFEGLFLECTLPSVEWEVEEVKEGGLNTYIHQLVGQQKSSSRIVLKNGVFKGPHNYIYKWFIKGFQGTFERKTVTVQLLDSYGEVMVTWHIENAIPVKWSAPEFKMDSNTMAISSLEFACGRITVECN